MRPLAATGALALAAVAFAAAADNAHEATVEIDGTAYVPAILTVQRGTRVTWVNRDPFPHTATARGAFDSRVIAADGKWSFVARKAGRIDYLCTLHPNMRGTLVVE